jgi:hypothetical protein
VSALFAFFGSAAGRRVFGFLKLVTLQNTAKGLSIPDFSIREQSVASKKKVDGKRSSVEVFFNPA